MYTKDDKFDKKTLDIITIFTLTSVLILDS